MNKTEMGKKIEELEKRIAALESRPIAKIEIQNPVQYPTFIPVPINPFNPCPYPTITY